MFRSLLLKEYLKLRAMGCLALAVHLAVLGYIYLSMRRLFLLDHAEVVWYRVIHLGTIYYEPLQLLPLLTGVLLAVAQFLPEMRGQRFRISLHLPMPPHVVVLGHLAVGLGIVLTLLLLDVGVLAVMTLERFPVEVAWRAVWTVLPWALAGLAGYLGTALVLLEPVWRLRAVNLLVGFGVVGLLLHRAAPGAYAPSLAWSALLVALLVPSILYPAYRFRLRRA